MTLAQVGTFVGLDDLCTFVTYIQNYDPLQETVSFETIIQNIIKTNDNIFKTTWPTPGNSAKTCFETIILCGCSGKHRLLATSIFLIETCSCPSSMYQLWTWSWSVRTCGPLPPNTSGETCMEVLVCAYIGEGGNI